MKCLRCEDILNFSKPPFGAYCCKNEHIQCAACELISSYCVKCGESTKYKSPHFLDETITDPKEMKNSKLQVPTIRDIKPTSEEEAQFRKLRSEYTLNKDRLLLNVHNNCDLNTARTLSAIVTKNLYTTANDNSQAEIANASHELCLQRIIRNLRDTRLSISENKNHEKKDNMEQKSKHEKYDQSDIDNLITPTHSKLKIPKTGADISKIDLKVEIDTVSAEKSAKNETGNVFNGADFKSLNCINLLQQKLEGFPISIENDGLDRCPFNCPLGNCVSKIFISDFNQHIIHDHPALALTPIKMGQFKDFFIDVNLCQNSYDIQSVACFLLRKIVVNFGVPPLKDVLPLTLMIGRYAMKNGQSRNDLKSFESNDCNIPWSNKDFFLVWLAGVTPAQCEITASISVFSKQNTALSRWYVDRVNSIQNIKDVESTFASAGRLVLSYPELKLLTSNFSEMLQCQVGILSCELKSKE